MWADDRAQLKNKYDSTIGGAEYVLFKANVASSLFNATLPDPDVLVDSAVSVTGDPMPSAPSNTSSVVQVRIQWLLPGEPASAMHNYTTTAVVGQN